MDQQQFTLPEEEGIDIKKYIFLILSHWWWFAIVMFVSLTIAYLVNRYSKDVYSANCSLIIGEQKTGAGSMENILDELSRFRSKQRKAVVENEVTILKSYKMARLALEELDFGITYTAVGRRNIAERQLYTESPFLVVPDTISNIYLGGKFYVNVLSPQKFLLGIDEDNMTSYFFGEEITLDNEIRLKLLLRNAEGYTYDAQKSNKYYFTIENNNSLAKTFSNALNVEVNAEKGSILNLSLSGFVPSQITDYLNKLCEVYIRSNLSEKNLASENTINFIDEQLRGVVDSLEVTGLRLQKFRSENKVINLSQEGSFLFAKLQDLQSEKATLDIKERYYKYLLEYIENKTDYRDVVAPSVVGIADNLLNNLVTELNQLNLERRNQSLSMVENSPQINLINNQIQNTRNALQENLESLVEGNNIALDELISRIDKIETEVQKLPGTERQLINIEREFTINDQIYTFLLEKRAEAGITRASNVSDHKILDIARPENATRIKPTTSANYMLALALGGGIPLVLLLLMDFFNTKITDRKYLEANIKAPIIGNIGHNDEQSDLPTSENPKSSISESFRALRTSLQYVVKGENDKVIAVSSAISGEGKTFTSVNLATIIAMTGKKVLLVSLDLRRPKVHRVFNLKNETGMSTHLIGKNTFDEIMFETNVNDLTIATSGPIPPNPAELLGSQQMIDFITQAKTRFDYIILDTPPVAIVTDTLSLKHLIDSFIFVIRHNYSDKQVVDLANSIYEKKLLNNTSVVVNDIQVKGYYGYSYRYGYGYGYGYGYSYRNTYYNENTQLTGFQKLFRKKTNI